MTGPKQLACALITLLFSSGAGAQVADLAKLEKKVEETERAFAKTMADRDHQAFRSFLSEETVFFSGSEPLRGASVVADAWAPYFADPDPPFSWAPETVVALDSGTLALSSGPVRDPAGKVVATFTSVWRLDPDGTWRIIFDKGCRVCAKPPMAEKE